MSQANQLVKIGLVAVMAGLYSSGAAAASISGDASALIITPLVLAETSPMDFGTIAPTAVAGTVALDIGGGRTPDANVNLITGGTEAAGQYTIQGNSGQAYSMSFSLDATLANAAGDQMTADNFSDNAPALTGAVQPFQIGATLNVGANQAVGAYSTATAGGSAFTVTANYD